MNLSIGWLVIPTRIKLGMLNSVLNQLPLPIPASGTLSSSSIWEQCVHQGDYQQLLLDVIFINNYKLGQVVVHAIKDVTESQNRTEYGWVNVQLRAAVHFTVPNLTNGVYYAPMHRLLRYAELPVPRISNTSYLLQYQLVNHANEWYSKLYNFENTPYSTTRPLWSPLPLTTLSTQQAWYSFMLDAVCVSPVDDIRGGFLSITKHSRQRALLGLLTLMNSHRKELPTLIVTTNTRYMEWKHVFDTHPTGLAITTPYIDTQEQNLLHLSAHIDVCLVTVYQLQMIDTHSQVWGRVILDINYVPLFSAKQHSPLLHLQSTIRWWVADKTPETVDSITQLLRWLGFANPEKQTTGLNPWNTGQTCANMRSSCSLPVLQHTLQDLTAQVIPNTCETNMIDATMGDDPEARVALSSAMHPLVTH